MQLTKQEFDKITEIIIKIEQIKVLYNTENKNETYVWNEPASPTDFEQFEEQYNIQLPRDYKIFLTYISNGGPFVGKGLYPLHKTYCPGILSKETYLYPQMNKLQYQSIAETIEKDLHKNPNQEIYNGILVIGKINEQKKYGLVFNGKHNGKVLTIDNTEHPPFNFSYQLNFLDLYENWLDACLDEIQSDDFLQLINKTETELIMDYHNSNDIETKIELLNSIESYVSLLDESIHVLKEHLLLEENKDLQLRLLKILRQQDKTFTQKILKANLRSLDTDTFETFVKHHINLLDFDTSDYGVLFARLDEITEFNYDEKTYLSASPFLLSLETLKDSEMYTFANLQPFLEHSDEHIVEIALLCISQTSDFRSHKNKLYYLLDSDYVLIVRTLLQILINATMSDEYVELFRPVLKKHKDDLLIPSLIERYLYKIKKPLDFYSQ